MGLLMEPSSRKAIHARPLAPTWRPRRRAYRSWHVPRHRRLSVDGLDDRALLICGGRKDLELGVGKDVGQVDQVHAIAGIGLVGAIGVHGLPVVHATQRRGHLDAHATEGIGKNLFERAHDIVLVHEGHLDIDLGELGLTVGTQVLVAEALGNLVVALDATDHEQLLQKLRGLRQGVEVARLDAVGTMKSRAPRAWT